MPAGGVEELPGAQEVPAAAGRGRRPPEELEEPLAAPVGGGRHGPGGVERIPGEEALLADARGRDAAPGDGQGTPGATQVNERHLQQRRFRQMSQNTGSGHI